MPSETRRGRLPSPPRPPSRRQPIRSISTGNVSLPVEGTHPVVFQNPAVQPDVSTSQSSPADDVPRTLEHLSTVIQNLQSTLVPGLSALAASQADISVRLAILEGRHEDPSRSRDHPYPVHAVPQENGQQFLSTARAPPQEASPVLSTVHHTPTYFTLKPFVGTTPIELFIRQADIVAEANGWSEDTTAHAIVAQLQGPALEILNCLPSPGLTCIALREALEDRFGDKHLLD